jgi:prepilin-type processing-associated H-X9-DG protein
VTAPGVPPLAAAPPVMPPPMPGGAPGYATSPGYAAGSLPYSSGPYDQGAIKSSGWAITSLVFGIISFCIPFFASVVAIVTGIVGIVKTSRPRVGGRGMAIAGLVLGLLSMFTALPLEIGIMLPALNRAREQANRVKCASNMRQIGLAAIMYANAHGGQFPDDLDTILTSGTLQPFVVICPSSGDTPPSGASTQAMVADMKNPGHLSYVYVGKGLTVSSSADTVVMYEPTANHSGDGMNALFADGHVEWLTGPEAQSILSQQSKGITPIKTGGP